jgi:hypothetical protein
MNMKSLYHQLANFLSNLRTRTLMSAMFLLGFLFLALLSTYSGDANPVAHDIFFSLAFLAWGSSGVVMIIRREVDIGLVSFYGPLAVALGLIMAISSFFLASIPLIIRVFPSN